MTKVAVLDIGKTNLKVALVDLETLSEIAVETAPNRVDATGPWPHFDVSAQRDFLFKGLRKLALSRSIDAISVTTHGACAALLDGDGNLAAPVLDYEFTGPDLLRRDYDAIRPAFSETGSPALPMGLNLGAQLHYMLATDPSLRDRLSCVVTWPQYWGYLLTGNLACDLSSLGCHTDLWDPHNGQWSTLVSKLGIASAMAPPRKATDLLGTLTPACQRELGLGKVPVYVGIHDSNASLLPHLRCQPQPFSVVSTGTWVISMAIGGRAENLDPSRDTLINVDAFGSPVPSARFMGGREYALISAGRSLTCSNEDEAAVLTKRVMLMPSVVSDCGPFPDLKHEWTSPPARDGELAAALGYYLALMTAECLKNIGAEGPTVVEGPFAQNRQYLDMLATATGREVQTSSARTGTAIGAALLCADQVAQTGPRQRVSPSSRHLDYARLWQERVTKR